MIKSNRGKSAFPLYNQWFELSRSVNVILRTSGKVTIHCRGVRDYEILQSLLTKDTYALRAFNSYTIFIKGWDK